VKGLLKDGLEKEDLEHVPGMFQTTIILVNTAVMTRSIILFGFGSLIFRERGENIHKFVDNEYFYLNNKHYSEMTTPHKDKAKSIYQPIIYLNKEYLLCKISKYGFGRPQTPEDALQKGGEYYLVKQHIKSSKVCKSNQGASWEEATAANHRFLEIYGPLGYDSYRWQKWFILREGIERFNDVQRAYRSNFYVGSES